MSGAEPQDAARTSGYLEIPGVTLSDGVTPDPMPFDHVEWQLWYVRVLAHRVRVKQLCNQSGSAGENARRTQKALCKQPDGLGHIYWLITFCFLTEQRQEGAGVIRPFIVYPRQAELILAIHQTMKAPPGTNASLAVEKSRDVGATWIDSSHHAWCWLFESYYTGLLISEDADKVDKKNDQNCWMWKIDFLLGRYMRGVGNDYPKWLMPKGCVWGVNEQNFRTLLQLTNLETSATIQGEAQNVTAGRSARVRKASIDEAAFNQYFGDIWNLLANTTDHRFAYSTAGMKPPDFYNLVHGKEGYRRPRVMRIEWHHIPGRDRAWLEAKRSEMKRSDFEREVMINYLAGSGSVVYPEAAYVKTGFFPYERNLGPLFGAIDDGGDDPTAITIFQREAGTSWVRVVGAIEVKEWTIRQCAALIIGEAQSGVRYDRRELEWIRWAHEVGLHRAIWYGDRHGFQRNQETGGSPFDVLANEFGVFINVHRTPEENSFDMRHESLKELIPWLKVHEGNGAPLFLEAIQLHRFQQRKAGLQSTTPVKPVHDHTSHLTACGEIFAVHEPVRQRHGAAKPLPRNIANGDPEPMSMGRFADRRVLSMQRWSR